MSSSNIEKEECWPAVLMSWIKCTSLVSLFLVLVSMQTHLHVQEHDLLLQNLDHAVAHEEQCSSPGSLRCAFTCWKLLLDISPPGSLGTRSVSRDALVTIFSGLHYRSSGAKGPAPKQLACKGCALWFKSIGTRVSEVHFKRQATGGECVIVSSCSWRPAGVGLLQLCDASAMFRQTLPR